LYPNISTDLFSDFLACPSGWWDFEGKQCIFNSEDQTVYKPTEWYYHNPCRKTNLLIFSIYHKVVISVGLFVCPIITQEPLLLQLLDGIPYLVPLKCWWKTDFFKSANLFIMQSNANPHTFLTSYSSWKFSNKQRNYTLIYIFE